MNGTSFILILFGVALNTVAQLCLKQGMVQIGEVSLQLTGLLDLLCRASGNLYVVSGMVCYVLSFGVWLVVLSRVEVSCAYPMLSIGYVVTAVMGYCFWGESLGSSKIFGILLICVGVGVMFRE